MAKQQQKQQAQGPTAKAAAKQEDPSVKSLRGMSAYPEGTHPPVAPSDASWGPDRFSYDELSADLKPDETTVAQELTADSLHDDAVEALQADAPGAQK